MSERNFVRKFLGDTGLTPGEFVMSARLEAARRLLAESRMAPKAVAERCGFSSAATLGRTFRSRFGVSPAQYRDKFQVEELVQGSLGNLPRPSRNEVVQRP